jgi:hypothetical protein
MGDGSDRMSAMKTQMIDTKAALATLPDLHERDMEKPVPFTYIPRQTQSLPLYAGYNVSITFQDFGKDTWLIILRGSAQDIERVSYGLYNFRATNGELSWRNHAKTTATIWSSRAAMRRFFFNQKFFSLQKWQGNKRERSAINRKAMKFAHTQLASLMTMREHFLEHDGANVEAHTLGSITAERPDSDFKDLAFAHAEKHG